jgi:hypothetical protein
MSTLEKMSYNISCDHIKQLDEKYNTDNERIFKEKIICFNSEDNDYINKNIGYLNNIYVSRKSCVYKSTEPDELKWTNAFIINNDYKNIINNDYKKNYGYNEITRAIFNENTRRKILTKY